jgi:uncharacterized protein YbjT (DUF2867 family)
MMVRRDDDRMVALRGLGAKVVIADLTRPESGAAALKSVVRMPLRRWPALIREPAPRGHVPRQLSGSRSVRGIAAMSVDGRDRYRLVWYAPSVSFPDGSCPVAMTASIA